MTYQDALHSECPGQPAVRSRASRWLSAKPAVWAVLAMFCSAGCGNDPALDAPPDEVDTHTTHDAGKKKDGSISSSSKDGGAHDDDTHTTSTDHATEPDGAVKDAAVAGDAGKGGDHGHMAVDAGMMEACSYHGAPDARDDSIKDSNAVVTTVGTGKDTLLPEAVLAWMKEKEFAEAHDAWHLIRRWDQGCRKSNAPSAGCRSAESLTSKGLWRADIQQGGPGDGYAFMAMHRHMIHMLKQSFPKHQELFAGFKKVPRTKADPENPMTWRNVSWTSNNLTGFDTLENIEKNLDKFPTEDDLGRYFQVTFKWSAQRPNNPTNEPGAGLHGALHAQWSVSGSPANLIDQKVDVRNFIFWKLHGWADDVWERYRKAKGITEEDAQFKKVMLEQCLEMIALQPSTRGNGGSRDGGVAMPGGAGETGVFAKQVRPILEEKCAGCHGESGGMAGLTLGGSGVASLDLLDGMVGAESTNGQYKLIEPGQPDKSWVYLKASGQSSTVACTGMCDREKMPPSGAGLTAAELTVLRDWITSGATEK